MAFDRLGSGDGPVVEPQTGDQKVAGSSPGRIGGRIFDSHSFRDRYK